MGIKLAEILKSQRPQHRWGRPGGSIRNPGTQRVVGGAQQTDVLGDTFEDLAD
jgi:hypothetical protein